MTGPAKVAPRRIALLPNGVSTQKAAIATSA